MASKDSRHAAQQPVSSENLSEPESGLVTTKGFMVIKELQLSFQNRACL